MPALTNEDVKWYVATRKDSGAHSVKNENYMDAYEREYERIREFETVEEAVEACSIRQSAYSTHTKATESKMIKAGKLRGDIKKGSNEDEDVRAAMRAEILEELKKQEAVKPPSSGATMGPATKKRTSRAKVKPKE